MSGRVALDGKFFRVGSERFRFRGVTYGTFKPRASDGARFPEHRGIDDDFKAISGAGFSVVRTYTEPTPDLVDAAGAHGLRVLAGVFYPDWRYLVGQARKDQQRIVGTAREQVRSAARRFAGDETILGVCLGNEVPADVVRWLGKNLVADALGGLAEIAHDEDPGQLVTYANYPTAEYLPLEGLDFLTFNVFLERQVDFRRYLTRLHHLAGDRPLVLGEVGLDASGGTADGEETQAQFLDWQLETATERGLGGTCVFSWTDQWWVGDAAVEDWHFGLTRADRSPRPSLEVARKWNARDVRDLPYPWPSISVVICAYNARSTLDECLRHTCALDYPDLEILVVDDGSTDETAAIALEHPRAKLVSIPHGGLSVARNAGFAAACGDLVAYLDSDAYPSPEWLYFLALGLDDPTLGGVGGPNVPPPGDPLGAHQVACAPGGPLHVLLSDDRAEHIPGCNMAFRKEVLTEVGGFDPVYTSAGDDVDLCWRVLDRDWAIGFHPGALVWHHRRSGLRPYLRQQRGYGRSEALVEARHPDRFTRTGSARWRGSIYDSFPLSIRHQRVYRGVYGAAAYQSVYRNGGYAVDLAHQVGLPIAAIGLLSAPAVLLSSWLIVPFMLAASWTVGLFVLDMTQARPPRLTRGMALRFRLGVATMDVLQPLVRTWGRSRHRALARRDLPPATKLPGPVTRCGRTVLLLPDTQGRAVLAATIVTALRRAGMRIIPATGWEDHDARILGSLFVHGDLVTSAHPVGSVQLRVRRHPRRRMIAAFAVLLLLAALVSPWAAAVLAATGMVQTMIGLWRTGAGVRKVVHAATSPVEGIPEAVGGVVGLTTPTPTPASKRSSVTK